MEGEEPSSEQIDQWRKYLAQWPRESVVRHPLAVSVASFEDFRALPRRLEYDPIEITFYRARYAIRRQQDKLPPLMLELRAVLGESTELRYFELSPLSEAPEWAQIFFAALGRSVIWEFVNWFANEQRHMQGLDEQTMSMFRQPELLVNTTIFDPSPSLPGRPSHEEDNWAWEQVHIYNRPKKEVKKEWLLRAAHRKLQTPDRAWRNAIASKRRK